MFFIFWSKNYGITHGITDLLFGCSDKDLYGTFVTIALTLYNFTGKITMSPSYYIITGLIDFRKAYNRALLG